MHNEIIQQLFSFSANDEMKIIKIQKWFRGCSCRSKQLPLIMCVYAYTNEILDLCKSYNNGDMSIILIDKLRKKEYNNVRKKDYYFIVLNKNNTNDIVVNSVNGLTKLTKNINNLPFQVCWNKNRNFEYGNINEKIKLFTDCFRNCEPSWAERFIFNIRII